jgi:hypothetical protein
MQQCLGLLRSSASLSPRSPGRSSMTESQLWHAIQDVRLLARQHVRTTRDGRVLSGRVNPVLEAIREAALGALERIQDGLPLSPAEELQASYLLAAQDHYRDRVRVLRRQLEQDAA